MFLLTINIRRKVLINISKAEFINKEIAIYLL